MTNRPRAVVVPGAFSVPEHLALFGNTLSAAGYPVTMVRLRGHAPGRSADLEGATLSHYLEDVLAEVDRAGPRPIIIGHSMGGLLAMKAAEQRRCSAALLFAPAPPGPLMMTAKAVPVFLGMIHRVLAGSVLEPPLGPLERLALGPMLPEARREALRLCVPESGAAFRDMIFGKMRVNPDAISCPVAILYGDQDVLVPPWQIRRTVKRLKATELRRPEMGHFLVGEPGWAEAERTVMDWLGRV